jgi:hypothetical protein
MAGRMLAGHWVTMISHACETSKYCQSTAVLEDNIEPLHDRQLISSFRRLIWHWQG